MIDRRQAVQPFPHLFPAANDNAVRGLGAIASHAAVREFRLLRYDEFARFRPANSDEADEPAPRMRRYLLTSACLLSVLSGLALIVHAGF